MNVETTKPLAMIVEDHVDTAELFVMALEAAGFATVVVTDGLEALAQMRELRPDLMTLDLQLPRVPGERVLERIRADDGLAQMRVILVTGEQQLASYLEEQADLVLLKPIAFDQLRDLAARMRSKLVR